MLYYRKQMVKKGGSPSERKRKLMDLVSDSEDESGPHKGKTMV